MLANLVSDPGIYSRSIHNTTRIIYNGALDGDVIFTLNAPPEGFGYTFVVIILMQRVLMINSNHC
jgi:hypothetical protein